MNFEQLNVKPEIISALKEMEITEPTTIQQQAIPLIRDGNDVIGMSRTGSGKTVAFGVPILEKIQPGQGIQVLILAPIRELAVQITQELKKFGKNLKFKTATIYGGVGFEPQVQALKRADIVVATPGRLLDHLERRTFDLYDLNTIILDEADKMVEMGFMEDVNYIFDYTPEDRQVLLFGATISNEINKLKKERMYEPKVAKAEMQVKEDFLEQYYYNIQKNEKFSLLVHLLNQEETNKVIVFCSTRNTVELIADNLNMHKIKAAKIHGKLSQNRRLKVIDGFDKGKTKILVASAVAARGIDIKDVTHVFNYDLSQDPQEYVHRVGRTARAGETGKAITLLCQRDYAAFDHILDRYRLEVRKLDPGQFPRVAFKTRFNGRNRRGNGGFRNGGGFGGRNGNSGRGGFGGRNGNSRRWNSNGRNSGRRPQQRNGFGRRKTANN